MMGEEAGNTNEVCILEILVCHAKELGPGISYRHCQAMIKAYVKDMIKWCHKTGVQIHAIGRPEHIYASSVEI